MPDTNKLEKVCKKFVEDNELYSEDDIANNDLLHDESTIYELIVDICEIIGYKKDK